MSFSEIEGEASCLKCQGDVNGSDRFCRHCGFECPAVGVRWDYKEQIPLHQLNALLAKFGCEIRDVETNRDEYAVQVCSLKKG